MGGQNHKKKSKQSQLTEVYAVGEKVLCYEPDPTKTKVLYDAKVRKVIKTEMGGETIIEYLIHFQGWNSSWDRYVDEELILKDNELNRVLQLELAEKAEEFFQSTTTKSKKRAARTIADLVKASLKGITSDDGGEGADCDSGNASPSEEDVPEEPDVEEPTISVVIPNQVREALDLDYFLVNKYEKLTELPAEPNIVQILEEYVKYFGLSELVAWMESAKHLPTQQSQIEPVSRNGRVTAYGQCSLLYFNTLQTSAPPVSLLCTGLDKLVILSGSDETASQDPLAPLYSRLQLVKEVAEGCRILIDFLLNRVLLYNVEQEQFEKSQDRLPHYNPTLVESGKFNAGIKSETEDTESEQDLPSSKKRKLKRGRDRTQSTQSHSSSSSVEEKPGLTKSVNSMIEEYKQKLFEWTLVPSSMYEQLPSSPSLIYGVNHLLRLFVKLPDILGRCNIPQKRLHFIVHHFSEIIDFAMKKRFYGPHLYIPAQTALKRTGRKKQSSKVKIEPYSTDDDESWKRNANTYLAESDIKIKIEKP